MKNKDTILRYLSDQMELSEKQHFEARLHSDDQLKKEFTKIELSLENLSQYSPVEDETNYFNNLIPKVHIKLDSRKQSKLLRLVPSISLAIAAALVIILQVPKMLNSNSTQISFSTNEITSVLSDTDDDVLLNYLESGLVDESNLYNYEKTEDHFEIYLDESLLSEIQSVNENSYYYLDYNSEYEDYSSEEADIIYQELLNKKIL